MTSANDLGRGQFTGSGPNGQAAVILAHHHQIGGLVLTHGPQSQPTGKPPEAGVWEEGRGAGSLSSGL